MKKLFLLCFLIPALLLCSCQSAPAAQTQATQTQAPTAQVVETESPAASSPTEATRPEGLLRPDLEEYLSGIATEVVTAFAYGKFEDVEHYMQYDLDEQLAKLFPDQSPPYTYEGYTFASKEALADAVRSQLISGEEAAFTLTVTGTQLLLYPGQYEYGYFGFEDHSIEEDYFGHRVADLKAAASIVVSFTIDNGEESSGSMYVNFLLIGDQWKVFSPTVGGYFLQLYTPTQPSRN